MKHLAILYLTLITCSPNAYAMDIYGQINKTIDEVVTFNTVAGQLAGASTNCSNIPKTEIINFQSNMYKGFVEYWGEEFKPYATNAYRQALNQSAKRLKPDGGECNELFFKMTEANLNYITLLRGGYLNPAVRPAPTDMMAKIKRDQQLRATVGTHICRIVKGTRTFNVAGLPTTKTAEWTFFLEGYIEAINDSKIKISIASIATPAIDREGIEYFSDLPPTYTKGLHVWEESERWGPC